MVSRPTPVLDGAALERLRSALDGFRVDAVDGLLGLDGGAALVRGDLAGVGRAVRRAEDRALGTLVELFLLGEPVEAHAAARALHPLRIEEAGPLLTASGREVRAHLEIRPYGEYGDARPWWLVSDFGSDVRPGPLATDHVLGVGTASTTLAQSTPRLPVTRALDVGTGCGVQSLHLAGHAASVTATDVSHRALACAAMTAALSAQSWDLRHGSLLEPVGGEQFDLVVANPPFVVSPGTDGYEYRDSGLPGDEVCRALITDLPGVLAPDGCAQLLANWIVPVGSTDWRERVGAWVSGTGCDGWVWQRELAAPDEYVALWLRDAGETPGTPRWRQRYDAWLDWFAANRVAAIGMGLVTLWRSRGPGGVTVLEDVPQAVQQPVGGLLPAWIARQRWLAATSDDRLLAARLTAAENLVLTRDDLLEPDGWTPAASRLRQATGMRWEVETDDAIAALVAACDGTVPIGVALDLLASMVGAENGLAAAAVPVIRDLVGRGFLVPSGAPT